ncbi:MAG: ATP-binding cassette domain-containing protein, partial [Planctomycetes bacterium]|nr:ATP-binding cassette domain-containing protein [Planctomycetota bacterium]
ALKRVASADLKARLDEVLEKCRIKDVANRIIGQLSKGYRQRVALADAIIHNPSILILDEPTIGLDPHQIRQTRELIKELATERTIILSTHILPEVEMICNRVIIINHGKIAAMDTLVNLVKDAAGRQKVKLEVRGPAAEIEQALSRLFKNVTVAETNGWNSFTIDTDKDIREEIYNACVSNKWTIRELRIEKETLEDLFIRVTAGE